MTIKKKWKPEHGDKYYFIYISMMNHEKYDVDLNSGDFLSIGDATIIDPDIESECNCFKNKRAAIKALKAIKKALEFTGE